MNFRFEHKELAWLFLLVPLLILFYTALLLWKRKVRKRMGEPALINALTAGFSSRFFLLKFILLLLAVTLGVISVMNPRTPGASGQVIRKGIDVVFALDVSKSMLAADLEPNRLERAKQFINKLMLSMPDDRVALVIFAGKAYMQMPLTADLGAAALYVAAAGPDIIPQQGTVISDALKMSSAVFNPAEKRFKSVVLISDGEDHDEAAIRTADEMARQGVMINCVGIGSPEGTTIPEPGTGQPKTDEAGNTVITKLNEEELKSIATATRGVYIHLLGTEEAVKTLNSQLAQIDRKAYGDESLMDFKTWYAWLAAGMLFIILAESFIPETKRQLA